MDHVFNIFEIFSFYLKNVVLYGYLKFDFLNNHA